LWMFYYILGGWLVANSERRDIRLLLLLEKKMSSPSVCKDSFAFLLFSLSMDSVLCFVQVVSNQSSWRCCCCYCCCCRRRLCERKMAWKWKHSAEFQHSRQRTEWEECRVLVGHHHRKELEKRHKTTSAAAALRLSARLMVVRDGHHHYHHLDTMKISRAATKFVSPHSSFSAPEPDSK
jgi:predicted protein tyrosine phosphatase